MNTTRTRQSDEFFSALENDMQKAEIQQKMQKCENSVLSKLYELNPQNYDYSDRGTSELFANVFGEKIRYNTTVKDWYVYDGRKWISDPEGMKIKGMAKQFYDALILYSLDIDDNARKTFVGYYNKYGSKNKRDTLIKDAADCCYIKSENFDTKTELINCQNGTFNLETYMLQPHDPKDLITKISNVWYDPNATAEEWEKFINEVLPQDREKVRYFQKAVGYSLTGTCELESCFILYGSTTRNGKSTAVSTISHMLGNDNGYARSAQPEVLAMKKHKDSRAPSEDIARLAGCRFLNVSEPPQSMAFDVALLKTLTGRDTITARFLNQGSFEYIPQFVLFINTNYLPKVLDDTLFSSKRINVIEFNKHFDVNEQDRTLKKRLQKKENISGLFNWCVEGLKAYRADGLISPMTVAISTRQYEKQSDKIGNFIDECLEPSEGGGCTAKDAYEVYKKWCTDCGYFTEGKQKFIEMLKAKNIFKLTATINGITVRNVICNHSISYI